MKNHAVIVPMLLRGNAYQSLRQPTNYGASIETRSLETEPGSGSEPPSKTLPKELNQ